MESADKMKRILCMLLILAAFSLVCSCATVIPDPIIIIQDPLVLQEVAPLPRAVVIARQTVSEYEPVFATLRVIEVSEVNGVQRYFLVRTGADKTGIAVGVTGEIADDATFQRVIGSYRIIELLGDFFRCEITELAYRIGTNAHVRVKTGEILKESSAP